MSHSGMTMKPSTGEFGVKVIHRSFPDSRQNKVFSREIRKIFHSEVYTYITLGGNRVLTDYDLPLPLRVHKVISTFMCKIKHLCTRSSVYNWDNWTVLSWDISTCCKIPNRDSIQHEIATTTSLLPHRKIEKYDSDSRALTAHLALKRFRLRLPTFTWTELWLDRPTPTPNNRFTCKML